MKKEFLADELGLNMQQELVKQASGEKPSLVKAAECLHAALEILEEQGLQSRADQVLRVLEKIAKSAPVLQKEAKIHSMKQLMEAGITQRDLNEFARGNPVAVAKLNLVLRKLGLSEHEISRFLGAGHLMTEEKAKEILNPNEPGSMLEFQSLAPQSSPPMPGAEGEGEGLEFMSYAAGKKKVKKPGRPDRIKDPHTKGLTPEKQVKNILDHGTQFNMADDNCAFDVPASVSIDALKADDMLPGFEELASISDISEADDELMAFDIGADSLEVSENDVPLEDFEDERD